MNYKDNWKLFARRINSSADKISSVPVLRYTAEEYVPRQSGKQDEYSLEIEQILENIESVLASKEEQSTAILPLNSSFLSRNSSQKNKHTSIFTKRNISNNRGNDTNDQTNNKYSPSIPTTLTSLTPKNTEIKDEIQKLDNGKILDVTPENTSSVSELEIEDGFILLPEKEFVISEHVFHGKEIMTEGGNRMTKSCFDIDGKPGTQSTPVSKDDVKVYLEYLEYQLRKITDPKKLCILKNKINHILFEMEMEQCQINKCECRKNKLEKMWKSSGFRKLVAENIEKIINEYDIHCIKSCAQLEDDQFIKSTTKDEYFINVNELMLTMLDINSASVNVDRKTDIFRVTSRVMQHLTEILLKCLDE